MSYDLNLWSVSHVPTAAIQRLLPDAKIRNDGIQWEGEGWLVTIDHSAEVECEDIPDEVMAALPGIAWMSSVNIEPSGAPAAVKRETKRVLKTLAKEFRGDVEDPQAEPVTESSGSHSASPKSMPTTGPL